MRHAFAVVLLGIAVACSSSGDAAPGGGDGSDAGTSDGGIDPRGDGATEPTDGATPDDDVVVAPVEGGASASCANLPKTCAGNHDCCEAKLVPGGSFNRSNDPSYPATVSDFSLDVYEVTVGRFRAFVEAGGGTQKNPPAPGSGAHPKIANSGWDASFDASLAADTAALKTALACRDGYPAWTDAPVGNENKPIDCITWFDAFAFCIWDGGRLPTETEWNYAAAGGSEQRLYPFGSSIDHSKASYECAGDGSGAGQCAFSDILPVGSKSTAGDGRWGHADLGGNIWEWTLDWYAFPYRLTTCNDCADLQPAPHRTFRGGGFPNESFYLTTNTRLEDVPTDRDYDVGVRCARNP